MLPEGPQAEAAAGHQHAAVKHFINLQPHVLIQVPGRQDAGQLMVPSPVS